MKNNISFTIKMITPLLLIILFIYAAVSKLLVLQDFKQQLYNQSFPHWMAGILLYTLIPVELLAVGLLSFPKTQQAGLVISSLLLAAFSGYIALILLHFWQRVPCSCGGILRQMGWGTHLLFNCFFLGIALAALMPENTKAA
jgi:hypothetical protein